MPEWLRPAAGENIECTVNRVGDVYFDQIKRSGHITRIDDLDQIAALGIKTLRYPVLWEHHASQPIDWGWADERLGRLRSLGIVPILGLVHHGSGPITTSLIDPDFPDRLAEFAQAVAERCTPRPLQRSVRPLVSPRPQRCDLCARPADPVPRRRAGRGLDTAGIDARPLAELGQQGARPRYVVSLDTASLTIDIIINDEKIGYN